MKYFMNNEIKEILELFKEYASGGMSGLYPPEETIKNLLDYITNLQKDRDDLDDYNRHLHNENKNLKQINEEHRKINGELRETINEAIEYMYDPDNFLCINVEEQGRVLMDEDAQNDLLNILKGSDG